MSGKVLSVLAFLFAFAGAPAFAANKNPVKGPVSSSLSFSLQPLNSKTACFVARDGQIFPGTLSKDRRIFTSQLFRNSKRLKFEKKRLTRSAYRRLSQKLSAQLAIVNLKCRNIFLTVVPTSKPTLQIVFPITVPTTFPTAVGTEAATPTEVAVQETPLATPTVVATNSPVPTSIGEPTPINPVPTLIVQPTSIGPSPTRIVPPATPIVVATNSPVPTSIGEPTPINPVPTLIVHPTPIFSTPTPIPQPSRSPGDICTAAELRSVESNLSGSYRQVCDIDLTGIQFAPIGGSVVSSGYFRGSFDGNGYAIRGLTYAGPESGLFISNAGSIRNVRLLDVDLRGVSVGGLTVINLREAQFSPNQAGGIIENIEVTGTMRSTTDGSTVSALGGITGKNFNTIRNVNTSVEISFGGGTFVGGISGGGDLGIIENAHSTGSITFTAPSFRQAVFYPQVVAYVGGLAGSAKEIRNSTAEMDIVIGGNGSSVGGLVGQAYGSILNCRAAGRVLGGSTGTGGLVGVITSNNLEIANCLAANLVTGRDNVGGFVGVSQGQNITIRNSLFLGSVIGRTYTGGGVGDFHTGSITQTMVDAAVASYPSHYNGNGNDTAGGLFGQSNAAIRDTLVTGRFVGVQQPSAFGWDNAGEISNSLARMSVSSLVDFQPFGFLVNNRGTVTSSYWDVLRTSAGGSDGGAGRTSSQLASASTYQGWDFNSVWEIRSSSIAGELSYAQFRPGIIPDAAGFTRIDTTIPSLRANLENSVLSNIDASGAVVRESSLSDTFFDGADLSNADLRSSVMVNASLFQADLRGADLSGVDLSGANFARAQLAGSRYDSKTVLPISTATAARKGMIFVPDSSPSAGNPEIISLCSPADFDLVRANLGGHFRLDCDIDLGGIVWIPIGSFAATNQRRHFYGVFDGNGHTIRGLRIDLNGTGGAGLFGYSGGTIRNLHLVDPFVRATGQNVGAVVGAFMVGAKVDGVHVFGATVTGSGRVGGLIGNNTTGVLSNSSFAGAVNSSGDEVGGLVGKNNGSIINSQFDGSVVGRNKVGGISGHGGGIDGGTFHGTVVGVEGVGGLFGWSGRSSTGTADGDLITSSTVLGQIIGTSQVGVLAGHLERGEIERSSVFGSTLNGATATEGNLVGWRDSFSLIQ